MMAYTDYYRYGVYDANEYTIYGIRCVEGFDTLKEARQYARDYEGEETDVRIYRHDEYGFIIWKDLYHG